MGLSPAVLARNTNPAANRRQREARLAGSRGRGGNGGRLRFDQQYKPTEGQKPDIIRLIPGDFKVRIAVPDEGIIEELPMEYWPYVTHWDARHKRFLNCSGGPWYFDFKRADKCYACEESWNSRERDEKTGKYKPGYIGRSNQSAFTLIHFHPYHEVPQTDANGQLVKGRDGQPYKTWVRCEGRGCKYCAGSIEVFSTVQARQMYWCVSDTHKTVLFEEGGAVSDHCRACGAPNAIRWESWACPNCGHIFFDETSQFSDERIAAQVEQLIHCPGCKEKVYAAESVFCENCALGTESNPAARSDIYDANLAVRAYKSGEAKGLQLSVKAQGVSAIPEEFAELAKPLPLDKMFAPTPLSMQAKILELGVPEDPEEHSESYEG